MASAKKLQDSFLKELEATQLPVSVFLVNGVKLHGLIEAFDDEVLLLKGSLTQIVYKHAISTVVPSKMISIDEK
ncbi:MAG: RNA chaperone Hfq [Legionellales bacterium RIFCSPHIGHO2_12_FULL_37_14]|nr:MAG: RNA chaperone Hfq [Legionellales bacterium RIFCSPHIGHO2_12_FULL_37_14]